MKRMNIRTAFILAVMAALIALTAVPASAALKRGDYRVTSARLNMRTKPATTASLITTIPDGAFVRIDGSTGTGWYKVIYNSYRGYVSASYIVDPFVRFGNKYAEYVTSAIRLRKAPKVASGNVIRTIPKGQRVFIIASVRGMYWYKVYYDGKIGYIMGGYFRSIAGNRRTVAVNLQLRSSPVVSSGNKICVIPKGKTLVLISKYNSQWYRVGYNGYYGYVAAGNFTTDRPSAGQTATLITDINMRSSRTTEADNVIRVIPKGAKVTILGVYSGNWYRVSYNGRTGYIRGGYFAS